MARPHDSWRAPDKTCQRHLVQKTSVMLGGQSILMGSSPMASAVQVAPASTILFGNLGYGAGAQIPRPSRRWHNRPWMGVPPARPGDLTRQHSKHHHLIATGPIFGEAPASEKTRVG